MMHRILGTTEDGPPFTLPPAAWMTKLKDKAARIRHALIVAYPQGWRAQHGLK